MTTNISMVRKVNYLIGNIKEVGVTRNTQVGRLEEGEGGLNEKSAHLKLWRVN